MVTELKEPSWMKELTDKDEPSWMQDITPTTPTETPLQPLEIPQGGMEIEDGILLMPDYSVLSGKQEIGRIDPQTGDFIEREPTWWEKLGNIVRWLPPNIPQALVQKYGFPAIEKVDLPFMIQDQAYELNKRQATGTELTDEQADFLNFYKQEVGNPPEFNEILARLHPAATPLLKWVGAKLDPSEELKGAYYGSVGVGSMLLQGIETPLSVALFATGGLGGATALESRLGQVAAKGGVTGRVAQAGQMLAAPVVGFEWTAGQILRLFPRLGAKVAEAITKVKWARYGKLTQRRVLEALDNALRVSPNLRAQATPEALSKIANGAHDLLRASRVQEIRWNAIFKEVGLTKFPSTVVTNAENRALNIYIRWGLEFAAPAKTDAAVSVLRGLGYTSEAIGKMSISVAWENMVAKLGITGTLKGIIAAYEPAMTVTGFAPTVTGTEATTVEFNPIVTKVGKGYEILQAGEPVGEISYATNVPGVNGIVIDRIDIIETAQRQGLATQAIQRVLEEAEASGVPLYTGMLEPDGVQLFNALEQRGIVSLTPAPQRMLGELVTRGVPEYAPTTAMAEWETVSGLPEGAPIREVLLRHEQLARSIDEGEATLEALETAPDPRISRLTSLIPTAAQAEGELAYITKGQYRKVWGREPKANILTPDGKRVRWEYALDELAQELRLEPIAQRAGMEAGEYLRRLITQAKEAKALITATRAALDADKTALEAIEKGLTAAQVTPGIPTKGKIIPKVAPDEKKLRQSIMATVKGKGISESKYRVLFKKVGGTRNLTEMGGDKLTEVLNAVREARPIKIKGKNVITAKTENAIQTLKDVLVAERKLTPEIYEGLKEYLDLPTDKYESRELFITERQARELIRQMNVEAEVGLTEWDIRVAEGLANKPELKTSIDELTQRIVTENKPKPKKGITIPFTKTAAEVSPTPSDVKLSGTMSFLRTLRRFQEQLGGREVTRIYDTSEMMVEQRRLNEITLANTVNAMKMEVPQLATIIKDKDAMARIQRWLDSDLKIADIEKPDLLPAELEVAQLFRRRYDQWKNAVRLERFKDAYYHFGGRAKAVVADLIKYGTEEAKDVSIPDAPLKDIKEAVGIYEASGETALKAYLDTKDWGVLKSGYSFSQILHPQLRMYRGTSVRATTTSLHSRKGLEFLRDERTPWERLIAYERQMIGLNLQPYLRKMDMEFRRAVESGRISPESARDAGNKISQFMREVKGYPIENPAVAFLLRIGGWSFGVLSKVPWMSVRNLHQNIAFGVDKSELTKAIVTKGFFRNPLTKRGRLDYTDALVHQYKGVAQEQMLMGYMGKTPIENLIRKTDYYHLSDKANRYLSMAGQGAKAERALKQYLKDRDAAKFLENSGANELSATEQVRILEYLALETYDYGGVLESVSGGEAAIRDIASKITTLIHFNYVRYLRSSVEMGDMGRVLGSLVAFPRSVVERYVDIFSRTKRLGGADRKRAVHALLAMIVGSVIASAMLTQLTGKKRDAYNPLLVLQWQVGGLAIGATQNLMELYRLISNLTFAEDEGQRKYYFDELALLIPQLGDSFIPFYGVTMNLLESLTDSKYMDRKWLRQIREVVDANYELNEEFYRIEREWLEKVQHGLFGTNTPSPTDLETSLTKLQGTEDMLGKVDIESFEKAKAKAQEKGKEFFDTEEDYIYTTSTLGSDINSATYALDPSEITKENGFSELVLEYMEYQVLFEDYKDSHPDKRYEYRERNPETDAQLFFWGYVSTIQSDTAKGLVLQMMGRYNIQPGGIRAFVDNMDKYYELLGQGSPFGGTTTTPDWGETTSEPSWMK